MFRLNDKNKQSTTIIRIDPICHTIIRHYNLQA